jgi:hypothetical protein
MFSIICVYNNVKILNGCLLKNLKQQEKVEFEFIGLDNTSEAYRSAAEALNEGARKANCKYLFFIHQDVELVGSDWLWKASRMLNMASNLGVAGVCGMSSIGKNNEERGRGLIYQGDGVWSWSNPVTKPEPVQTVDECLLIIPRMLFKLIQFDSKTFDGWHCYGVDYCLSAKKLGFEVYVIPLVIKHLAGTLDLYFSNLLRYEKSLLRKHHQFRKIYTTCGELSTVKLLERQIAATVNHYLFNMFSNIPLKQYIKNHFSKYL